MTILQYLSAFRLFGGDVLVLGLAVTVGVSVLKKTVLKNVTKKLYVLLPFILGAIVFAAYRCLAECSFAPLTAALCKTMEGGFACGCAATLYYVVYEQFLRVKLPAADEEKQTQEARQAGAPPAPQAADAQETGLDALLCGYVPAEALAEAVSALREGSSQLTEAAFASFVREALVRYAPALDEAERDTLARLVTEKLAAAR